MATTHVKRDADDESEWWRLLCWAQYKNFIIVLGRDVERRTSFECLKQKHHLLAVIGAAPRHTWRSKEERSWNENRHNTHTIHGRVFKGNEAKQERERKWEWAWAGRMLLNDKYNGMGLHLDPIASTEWKYLPYSGLLSVHPHTITKIYSKQTHTRIGLSLIPAHTQDNIDSEQQQQLSRQYRFTAQ